LKSWSLEVLESWSLGVGESGSRAVHHAGADFNTGGETVRISHS
jgi:hypothetical protein